MPRADDPLLTAVRGFAAFWVFVYHAWLSVGPQLLILPIPGLPIDLTPLASAGWAGVGVFYVLSGFLLWSVFDDWAMRRQASPLLTTFAKRRALRILPPYYAQIALLAVLGLVTNWVEPPRAATLALNLTLTHGFSFEHFQAVNNVWWTLSIEAQFYVVLPLLAWSVRRYGWSATLAFVFATMLAWRVAAFAVFRDAPIIERVWILEQLPGRIDQFVLGMFASHLARSPGGTGTRLRAWLRERDAVRTLLVLVAPVALVALAYLLHIGNFFLRYWAGHPWIYFWHFCAGLAAAISIYTIAIRADVTTAASRAWTRAAVAFGITSYSFYLWHELLLRWLGSALKAALGEATLTAFAANFVLGFVVCLSVAVAWYFAFERPFLSVRARLRRKASLGDEARALSR